MKSFAMSFLVLFAVCAFAEGLTGPRFPLEQQYGAYDAYVPTYFRWPQTNMQAATRNNARRDGSRRFVDKSNAVAFTPNIQHTGGIPYLSEFSEEKHQTYSSQVPGYYPQQQVSFYTSYQPIIERDSLNPATDDYTDAENNIESTTSMDDGLYEISTKKTTVTDFYESSTEKATVTDELFETTETVEHSTESAETTTDFSETSTFKENLEENSVANIEINNEETLDETSTPSTSESNNIDTSTPELLKYCWLPRGEFPSMNSCKNFINCWDGVAIEQECGPGTLFNDRTGYCDFPENVNCGSRPLYTSDSGIPSDCSVDYSTYRNPTNCSEYFVCVDHKPKLFTCGSSLYYNLKLRVCDYKYNVACDVRPRYKKEVDEEEEEEEIDTVTESVIESVAESKVVPCVNSGVDSPSDVECKE